MEVDANNSQLDVQRKMINEVYLEPLKTFLIAKDILSCLDARGVTCIRPVSSQIRRKNITGQHAEACQQLIDTLCESDERNWYQALVESLENTNYQLLAALLKDEQVPGKDYIYLMNQLMVFKDRVENEVNIRNILSKCIGENLINEQHREEIDCEERNSGNTSAVSMLLHYIHRQKPTWFRDFIRVLVKANYKDLAEDIAGKEEVNGWTQGIDVEDGLWESSVSNSSASTMDFRMEYVEGCSSQIPLMAENDPTSTQSMSVSRECQEAMDCEGACGGPINDVNLLVPDSMTQVKKAGLVKNVDCGDTTELFSHSRVAMSEMSVNDSAQHRPNDGDAIELYSRSNEAMSEISVEDNSLHRPNDGEDAMCLQEEIQEIQLRGYQCELAEKGLEGRNVIVCAPTGSGKTHVALYICKEHLEDNLEAKVIFFCNQVALVDQQFKAFRRYVNRKIFSLTGDKEDLPPLVDLLEEYDVIVMTPQILLDNYKWKGMNSLFDSGITLMVFDECHHTTKKHPYNRIMALYMDEKFEKGYAHAPQIVGLTASLGVGKANSNNQAMEHIVRLCANLDCDDICTVKSPANTDELKAHVSVPHQEVQHTAGRPSNDRFLMEMQSIMVKIEFYIKKEGHEMVKLVPKISGLLNSPTEKGNERYTQWATELRNTAFLLTEHKMRRRVLACIGDLQCYNEALVVAHDCRALDAMEYVEQKLASIRNQNHFDETDQWLDTIYKERKDLLEDLARRDQNPKLNALKLKILEAYQENPDSHGIVFVKTRALCTSMVSWMEDTEELRHLKPAKVTGANETASANGMTQRQQVDTLNYFKDGKHKIIIATSVAEEGLDIRSCNLVIRYQHVTNEIAMVQARGRARAECSQYLVIAEAGSGVGQKESINIIREAMMHNALVEVSKIPQQEFKAKKEKYQQEMKIDREIDAKIMSSKRRANGKKVYQFRCGKCHEFACMSTDFRVLQDSHHIVPDEDFMQRIKLVGHPKPVVYGEISKIGKISCKECAYDWGIQIRYKQVLFPVLKITSFALLDEYDNALGHIKKWKDSPFSVVPFGQEDLQKKITNFANAIN